MPTVLVKPGLYQRVEQIAEWKNQQTNALTEEALLDYLDKLELEKLTRELRAFEQMLDQLLPEYEGQYVAIHEGKVIDSDPELMVLHHRVYSKILVLPVLFKKVTTEIESDIVIRSPHVEDV